MRRVLLCAAGAAPGAALDHLHVASGTAVRAHPGLLTHHRADLVRVPTWLPGLYRLASPPPAGLEGT